MKKHLLLCLALAAATLSSQAQTAVSLTGTPPDASAMFDVSATDKGMLIPRVALTQTTLSAPVTSPLTSLMIYNTAAVNDVTPGYYYWNGTTWQRLVNGNGTFPTGSGTLNTIPKWTPNGTTLGNSLMTDDGTTVTNAAQYDVTGGTGTSYTTAPIEIRTTAIAPRLAFHYSGVVASQIAIENSGRIAIRDNPGTGYENFIAREITGTILYDQQDIGYYLDPNSTSNSALRIRGGALHGPNPSWGKYLLVGGDGRGPYVDNVDVASVSTTDGNLHVDAASAKGLYLNFYDGGVINFGNGANGIIGTVSTGGVLNMNTGYQVGGGAASGTYLRGNGTNFVQSAIQAGDLPGGSGNYIQNQYGGEQSANFWVSGTGNVGKLKFKGEGGNSGIANDGYAIYQEAGAWSHPYPDLAIGFHTGIKLGAHYSYNGIRFYNNSDFATQTMSVGDGDNNVRINYNIATVGDIVSNQNYGLGLVGLYASTRYQNVFAMGAAYRLAADGTTPGNLYGLAWTHSNVGGQSISNLGHQLLVMSNGGTTAAVGNGFWSSYGIDVGGNGTYNRFRTWTELTDYHGLYSGLNGAHFYPNDASYGSWRMLGTRNGWGGIEFPSGAGNISLMIGQGGWGGMTTGMHANSYGWLWRFEHQTLYCAAMYDTDNTGYYVNPNGYANLWQLQTNDVTYTSYSGNQTYVGWGWAYNYGYYCTYSCGWWNYSSCGTTCYDYYNKMQVNGRAYSYSWANFSDGRLKTNIGTISNALDMVKSMRGVTYDWKTNEATRAEAIKNADPVYISEPDKKAEKLQSQVGFIAQEIQNILPSAVSQIEEKDSTGAIIGTTLGVDYTSVIPVLVEAIKEQQKQIDELRALLGASTSGTPVQQTNYNTPPAGANSMSAGKTNSTNLSVKDAVKLLEDNLSFMTKEHQEQMKDFINEIKKSDKLNSEQLNKVLEFRNNIKEFQKNNQ